MSIGCIIKAVVGAAVLAVAGYFVVPFVGIDQNMPLGSVLAVGLFVGCLVVCFFVWAALVLAAQRMLACCMWVIFLLQREKMRCNAYLKRAVR